VKHTNFTPETIQNLEQCCADLFAVYRRAMAAAELIEKDWRQLTKYKRGHRTEEERAQIGTYERNRAKFRSKANLYRRRAETILAVLQWAAPDKHREKRLRTGLESRPDKRQRGLTPIGPPEPAHKSHGQTL